MWWDKRELLVEFVKDVCIAPIAFMIRAWAKRRSWEFKTCAKHATNLATIPFLLVVLVSISIDVFTCFACLTIVARSFFLPKKRRSPGVLKDFPFFKDKTSSVPFGEMDARNIEQTIEKVQDTVQAHLEDGGVDDGFWETSPGPIVALIVAKKMQFRLNKFVLAGLCYIDAEPPAREPEEAEEECPDLVQVPATKGSTAEHTPSRRKAAGASKRAARQRRTEHDVSNLKWCERKADSSKRTPTSERRERKEK